MFNAKGETYLATNKSAQIILTTINAKNGKVVDIEKEIDANLIKLPYGLEPEVIHFILVVLTTLGKISLKGKGGDEIDIANIKEKFRSISQFENIIYAVKKDDLSYDFANNLLNSLGLNGAKMLRETTRNEGFLEYKTKLKYIAENIRNINFQISKLEAKTPRFLNLDSAKSKATKITRI